MKCTMCKGEGKLIIDSQMCNCPICEGTGQILKCRTCKGVGLNTISRNNSWKTGPCMICIGHGFVPEALYVCKICNNTGITHNITVIYDEDGGKDQIYEKDYCDCVSEEDYR